MWLDYSGHKDTSILMCKTEGIKDEQIPAAPLYPGLQTVSG